MRCAAAAVLLLLLLLLLRCLLAEWRRRTLEVASRVRLEIYRHVSRSNFRYY